MILVSMDLGQVDSPNDGESGVVRVLGVRSGGSVGLSGGAGTR